MSQESYDGREQTAAKHLILTKYLQTLALKIGQSRKHLTFNYVDGFSGPWKSRADDQSDTSPALALEQLLEVREKLMGRGCNFIVRAFFIAYTEEAEGKLKALRSRFTGAAIEVVRGTFEEHIEDARRFVRVGRDPFGFVFIDPTGWTGFRLKAITPLLREARHGEVLINFMTGHISRFIDNPPPNVDASFDELFGDAVRREAWQGLAGLDREDRIVETYCDRLAHAGGYKHCVSAMILNPSSDRTHYHLVYGTRSDEGLVAFREIERKGLSFQRDRRADAQEQLKAIRTRQPGLFEGRQLVGRAYEDELRERYVPRAVQRIDAMLAAQGDVLWDDLLIEALCVPLVSESDVKQWLADRVAQGAVKVIGLAPRAWVPQRGRGHRIRVGA